MKSPISLLRGNVHAGESLVFGTLGVSLFVYSLYSHYQEDVPWKLSPYLFPLFIALSLILVAIAMLIQGKKKGEEIGVSGAASAGMPKKVIGFTALVVIYYILLPFLGFLVTNTLMLMLFFLYLGVRPWWKAFLFSGAFTYLTHVVFQLLLHVRLPQGVL
ncbi:MAG: tripartite tricarboxylate transporter TctB family protein [Sphaerochaetaceae bacterium]|nr:tripartite tricarboxylate transporter TctB family protein [Sphaerochaetaceae bacterium]